MPLGVGSHRQLQRAAHRELYSDHSDAGSDATNHDGTPPSVVDDPRPTVAIPGTSGHVGAPGAVDLRDQRFVSTDMAAASDAVVRRELDARRRAAVLDRVRAQ